MKNLCYLPCVNRLTKREGDTKVIDLIFIHRAKVQIGVLIRNMEETTRTKSHGDYWFIVQYKGFNRCIEIECVGRSSHP
jgi:hypothetical protein